MASRNYVSRDGGLRSAKIEKIITVDHEEREHGVNIWGGHQNAPQILTP